MSKVSEDTLSALKNLQERAQEGELIGIAFIGIHRGRRVVTGWAGEAGSKPFTALGVLDRLKDRLLDHAEEMGL